MYRIFQLYVLQGRIFEETFLNMKIYFEFLYSVSVNHFCFLEN